METNKITIRGSFKGISGNFTKNIVYLLVILIVYLIANVNKNKYFRRHNITSLWNFIKGFTEPKIIIILLSLYLLIFILLVLGISITIKIIALLYETQKLVIIDYSTGKITEETLSFPFTKSQEESKFNDIISVNITQDMLHRLFNSGDLYLEYMTYTKVDSKIRNMEITYVESPHKIKSKMI
jgi:hypothetical protein